MKADTIRSLESQIKKARVAYYNGNAIMSDTKFDLLEEKLRKLHPESSVLKQIGAAVSNKKIKVRLPVPMSSLNKAHNQDTLNQFVESTKKHSDHYLVLPKFDGAALLLEYKNSKLTGAYTRGNGIQGGDVSYLIKYLPVPKTLSAPVSAKRTVYIRGELAMKASRFETWEMKYDNPRQLVSGVLNKKGIHEALCDCTFYAFSISGFVPSQAFNILRNQGFNFPASTVANSNLNHDKLSVLLSKWRKEIEVGLDGLVLMVDKEEKVQFGDNPKLSIAVKDNLQADSSHTKVVAVTWRYTRTAKLFPRIELEPIVLNGVTVTYCSGKSGSFIKKNKIGVGAIVNVKRSGDVIPDISPEDIIVPAKKIAEPDVPYKVDGEHYFALQQNLSKEMAEAQAIQRITHYLTVLGIEGLKGKMVETLYRDHEITSIQKMHKLLKNYALCSMINANVGKASIQYTELLNTKVLAAKVFHSLEVYGGDFGEKRYQLLFDHYQEKALSQEFVNLMSVKGIGEEFRSRIARRHNSAKKKIYWIVSNFDLVLQKQKTILSSRFIGRRFVFTGVRDENLEKQIVENGGEVIDNVKKATDLIVKDVNSSSQKMSLARQLKIKIHAHKDFKV